MPLLKQEASRKYKMKLKLEQSATMTYSAVCLLSSSVQMLLSGVHLPENINFLGILFGFSFFALANFVLTLPLGAGAVTVFATIKNASFESSQLQNQKCKLMNRVSRNWLICMTISLPLKTFIDMSLMNQSPLNLFLTELITFTISLLGLVAVLVAIRLARIDNHSQ